MKADKNLRARVQENLSTVVQLREYFHQYPELSEKEFKTAEKVYQTLESYGVESLEYIADTGVTCLIRGNSPGLNILLRADMDALPIEESADVPYRSQNKGVMHACGHDGHTASLLGVAKILSENRDLFSGTIRFAFQPAEEGAGGAKRMIDAGILNSPKIDYAFAFHIHGFLPEGKIAVHKGGIWASCDDLTIKFIGKGGHGSQPYNCINPIVMATDFLTRMNQYMAQQVQGKLGCVLSFGQFTAGSAPNIIPESAILKGTLRTFDNEVREQLLKVIQTNIEQVCELYGGHFDYDPYFFAPPCKNDDALYDKAAAILQDKLPEQLVYLDEANSGSEDFAFFSQEVPSFFFLLGVKEDRDLYLHTPDLKWNSRALEYSMWAMLEIVCNLK